MRERLRKAKKSMTDKLQQRQLNKKKAKFDKCQTFLKNINPNDKKEITPGLKRVYCGNASKKEYPFGYESCMEEVEHKIVNCDNLKAPKEEAANSEGQPPTPSQSRPSSTSSPPPGPKSPRESIARSRLRMNKSKSSGGKSRRRSSRKSSKRSSRRRSRKSRR